MPVDSQTAEASFYVFPPGKTGAAAAEEIPAAAGAQATPSAPTATSKPIGGESKEGGQSGDPGGDGPPQPHPPGDPGLAAMTGDGSRGLDLRPDQGGDHE